MSKYDKIKSEIEELGQVETVRFTCACAERVLVLVRIVAGSDVFALCRQAVDSAWDLDTPPAARAELEARIRALPVADIDDSHDPQYYAMLAVGVVVESLRAALEGSEAATGAATVSQDLVHNFEYVAGEAGLLAAEETAELQTLELLRSAGAAAAQSELIAIGAPVSAALERATRRLEERPQIASLHESLREVLPASVSCIRTRLGGVEIVEMEQRRIDGASRTLTVDWIGDVGGDAADRYKMSASADGARPEQIANHELIATRDHVISTAMSWLADERPWRDP